MEMNWGDEDMMKSAPSPVVTVKSAVAVHEAEIALIAKLPPGASPGTFSVRFQLPSWSIVPVPSCCPALGPESQLSVTFSLGRNWETKNVIWPPWATTDGDAESSGWPSAPTVTVRKRSFCCPP